MHRHGTASLSALDEGAYISRLPNNKTCAPKSLTRATWRLGANPSNILHNQVGRKLQSITEDHRGETIQGTCKKIVFRVMAGQDTAIASSLHRRHHTGPATNAGHLAVADKSSIGLKKNQRNPATQKIKGISYLGSWAPLIVPCKIHFPPSLFYNPMRQMRGCRPDI